MRFVTTILVRSVVCSSILLAVGCGPSSDRAETAPVNGTVTYNGEVVAGASVNFSPPDAKTGYVAVGTTNLKGEFKLTTFDTNDGAVPGKYNVTIIKRTNPLDSVEGSDPTEMLQLGQGAPVAGKTIGKAEALIPEKYFKPETSGLVYTVDKGGKDFTIELTDD